MRKGVAMKRVINVTSCREFMHYPIIMQLSRLHLFSFLYFKVEKKDINFYKFSNIVLSQNLLQLGKGGIGLYAKAGEMST